MWRRAVSLLRTRAAFVAVLVVLSIRISRHWTAVELVTFDEYTNAAAELKSFHDTVTDTPWYLMLGLLPRAMHALKLTGVVRFHKMRLRFIAANSLQPDFNFA